MALRLWRDGNNLLFVLVIDAYNAQSHTVRDDGDTLHFHLRYCRYIISNLQIKH